MRNKAQFLHNTKIEYNKGTLIVTRRPLALKQRGINHFKMCPSCGKMFSVFSLRVHLNKCKENATSNNNIVHSNKILRNIHPSASNRLVRDVIKSCRIDKITECFLFDPLCILYGNKLCVKYRNQHHIYLVRQRLREIGRFIYEFKKIKSIDGLTSILSPENYDNIVKTINEVAGLNTVHAKYRAPSTAYNLGLHLKYIVTILEAECIKKQDHKKRTEVRDLLCLMNEGFSTDINKTVSENQTEQKRHKKIILPTPEDISSLQRFLSNGIKRSSNRLKNEHNIKDWRSLGGYLLISLQLFNRRRAGELERIKIKDYET